MPLSALLVDGGDARPQHKDGQKENGKKTGDPWTAANQSARGSLGGGSSALSRRHSKEPAC